MKKILLLFTLMVSMAIHAQDKVLRIPYSSDKSIYGIISEPSADAKKHGTDDKVIPLDYSKRAVETYQNASLKIIDKAGHGFNPKERVLSNQYVKEFLSR